MSPEENISNTTKKAPAAPFLLTNFVLYNLYSIKKGTKVPFFIS